MRSILSVKSRRQKTWITTFKAINGRLHAQLAFQTSSELILQPEQSCWFGCRSPGEAKRLANPV
jgi:hypothetical protein